MTKTSLRCGYAEHVDGQRQRAALARSPGLPQYGRTIRLGESVRGRGRTRGYAGASVDRGLLGAADTPPPVACSPVGQLAVPCEQVVPRLGALAHVGRRLDRHAHGGADARRTSGPGRPCRPAVPGGPAGPVGPGAPLRPQRLPVRWARRVRSGRALLRPPAPLGLPVSQADPARRAPLRDPSGQPARSVPWDRSRRSTRLIRGCRSASPLACTPCTHSAGRPGRWASGRGRRRRPTCRRHSHRGPAAGLGGRRKSAPRDTARSPCRGPLCRDRRPAPGTWPCAGRASRPSRTGRWARRAPAARPGASRRSLPRGSRDACPSAWAGGGTHFPPRTRRDRNRHGAASSCSAARPGWSTSPGSLSTGPLRLA